MKSWVTFCFFTVPNCFVHFLPRSISHGWLLIDCSIFFPICSLKMTETGLAFSGGGIRSAAFSSGVLRRLLQRNTKIDYLSCVSGGGYTGSAYVDWKYRNGNNDDPEWHQRFFEHMRERSGLMCNWQIPLHGVVNTLIILFLILFVCVLMPLILWSPYVFPVAYAIDLLFGNLLRAEFHCPDASTTSPPLNNTADNATLHVSQGTQRSLCQVKTGTEVYYRVVLFSFLASMFVLFFILSIAKKFSKYQYGLFLVSSIFGLLFSFTFLPFCIQYLSKDTPVWVQLLVLVFSLAVWIFFPVLRSRSSFVVVVYLYSYFVYWRVFKDSIFGLKYSDYLFFRLMFAFGFVLWIAPALGAFQQRLVYLFNRYVNKSTLFVFSSFMKIWKKRQTKKTTSKHNKIMKQQKKNNNNKKKNNKNKNRLTWQPVYVAESIRLFLHETVSFCHWNMLESFPSG